MSLAFRRLCLTALAAVLVPAVGCTQLDVNKPFSWPLGKNDEPGTPNKVVAMWTDTVLYQPNLSPTRGFGGRLMFYGNDAEKPIKVDGSLVVYGFDETVGEPGKVKPDRKYVFTPEQLAKHYSKSDLGHSYSIWVPWDKVGGQQKEISLIVRFMPKQGDLLVGKQAKYMLPGRRPTDVERALVGDGADPSAAARQVHTVSYELPVAVNHVESARGDGHQQMTTTTIGMPPRFGGRPPVAVSNTPGSALTAGYPQAARGSVPGGPAVQPGYPQGYRGLPAVPPPQALAQPAWQAPAPQAPQQSAARSSRARFPVREERASRQDHDRSHWRQRPVGLPSRPLPAPPVQTATGTAAIPSNAVPAWYPPPSVVQ